MALAMLWISMTKHHVNIACAIVISLSNVHVTDPIIVVICNVVMAATHRLKFNLYSNE